MNLIQAFEKNLIDGFDTSSPDKIIETIVSEIFFYGNKVYKVYKYEKFFFGDFSNQDFRKDFYKEDFYWNNIMAPHIYLALHGVKKFLNKYKIVDLPKAEDFFIEMKKFDTNKTLTNLLLKKQITDKNLAEIVAKMTTRVKKLTANRKDNLMTRNLAEAQQEDLESDRNLLYMIPSHISKEKTDEIIDFLKGVSKKISYFQNYNSNNLSLSIDNHADNIVFLNDEAEFIDVLPPKEDWRVFDYCFNICRLATDVAVLWSEKKANIIYQTYEKIAESIPTDVKTIYEIRSALIQLWCFYDLKKPEIAEEYLKFIEKRMLSLPT